MYLPPCKWAWLSLITLMGCQSSHLELGRADNPLMRLPFFGGGVGHLLRYLHPLAVAPGTPPRGRLSELRSELDANYVSYRGAQLWKLNFNSSRAMSMLEDRDEEKEEEVPEGEPSSSPDEQFNEAVALFGESLTRRVAGPTCPPGLSSATKTQRRQSSSRE